MHKSNQMQSFLTRAIFHSWHLPSHPKCFFARRSKDSYDETPVLIVVSAWGWWNLFSVLQRGARFEILFRRRIEEDRRSFAASFACFTNKSLRHFASNWTPTFCPFASAIQQNKLCGCWLKTTKTPERGCWLRNEFAVERAQTGRGSSSASDAQRGGASGCRAQLAHAKREIPLLLLLAKRGSLTLSTHCFLPTVPLVHVILSWLFE
jgi:hypothetical protein